MSTNEADGGVVAATERWRRLVAERLGPPPLVLDDAIRHLHVEVLRIHGLLLEHLERQEAGAFAPPPRERDPDVLDAARVDRMIRAAEAEALARDVRLPLCELVARFGLTTAERDVLMLAVARAVAPGTLPLLVSAHGGEGRDFVTVALATGVVTGDVFFAPPAPDLFGVRSRLLGHRLLRVVPMGGRPVDDMNDRALVASPAVVSFLMGQVEVSEPIAGLAELVRQPGKLSDLVVDATSLRRLEAFALSLGPYLALAGAADGSGLDHGLLVLLSGGAGAALQASSEALAGSAGRPLLRISGSRLLSHPRPTEAVDEVYAQAALLDAVVCLDEADLVLDKVGPVFSHLVDGARGHRGLTLLTSARAQGIASQLEQHLVGQIRIERPDAALREHLWESAIPASVEVDGDLRLTDLAIQYELTPAQVENAVAAAYLAAARRQPERPVLSMADLEAAAREQITARLEDTGAYRPSKRGLDSIVLPEETEKSVRELLDACEHRREVLHEWGFAKRLSTGKGIVALFSGEPGTGKTYCVELIAGTLGMNVHAVAIPQIMSKWVGETEANIARLFSHARAQNTLLVFDEADALFTTRVKVETSSDRFSNMEVNQLLQEIDRFEGIVILTTNLETSIDHAFRRRITFHVKFPMPDKRIRARIWRTLLPPEAPVSGDLDFDDLAVDYELSGGHIRNILVRAAYRARARQAAIDMDLLREVAEDECRAAGKLFRSASFEG